MHRFGLLLAVLLGVATLFGSREAHAQLLPACEIVESTTSFAWPPVLAGQPQSVPGEPECGEAPGDGGGLADEGVLGGPFCNAEGSSDLAPPWLATVPLSNAQILAATPCGKVQFEDPTLVPFGGDPPAKVPATAALVGLPPAALPSLPELFDAPAGFHPVAAEGPGPRGVRRGVFHPPR